MSTAMRFFNSCQTETNVSVGWVFGWEIMVLQWEEKHWRWFGWYCCRATCGNERLNGQRESGREIESDRQTESDRETESDRAIESVRVAESDREIERHRETESDGETDVYRGIESDGETYT